MRNAISRHWLTVLLVLCTASFTRADIIVQTFQDLNNNGSKDDGEELITGLVVEAIDALGNVRPFIEVSEGSFTLPSLFIESRLRVRVTGYDDSLLEGVAGPSSVFFVEDGANVLVPVSAGPNFDPIGSRILIPCYDGGPVKDKNTPGFVSFPYAVDGVAANKGGDAPSPQTDAEIQEIGSTWGVAYQQAQQRAFTSALVKRHVGLGPQREGGLYVIDYSGAEPQVSGMSIQGMVPSAGPAIDLGNVIREIVDGDVDETMPYALTTAENTATYDMDAFEKVGMAGFGDIDLTTDERSLWMVNLNQRSLIEMDVSGTGPVSPSTNNLKHHPIANLPGLPNLNFRYAMCINAGGNLNGNGAEPFTDANGVAWDKNKYSTSTGNQDFAYRTFTVNNLLNASEKTSSAPLYHTFKKGSFAYNIPIPTEESYTVTLHFAEPSASHVVGDRIFDIIAEGQVVAANFDIVAKAGAARTATTFEFEIAGVGDKLDIEFVAKQGQKVKEAIVSGVEVMGESVMESGVLRPWGLTFHGSLGYLGLVSDGMVSKSRDHLFGYVLSFDPNNIEAGFTEVLAFPLAYPRERASNAHLATPQPLRSAEWQAWVQDWESTAIQTDKEQKSTSGALLTAYPQPILSDIDFTLDGDLVIGLMDRWAHQMGYRNYPSVLGDQTLIVSYGAGDLLKAFDDQGILRLEIEDNDNGQFFRSDDGPSFSGEFFYDDHFVASAAHHGEIFTGGLGILPGSGEVVNTVFNPIVVTNLDNFVNQGVYTQGIHFYDTENGAKERAYLFVDQFRSGKANGLGDMEFASALIGGEMGNYVWCDGNGNGIQDPQEFGIDGIVLTLHDKENSGQQVDMVTTENGGEFIFSNVLPNHCYSIRIDLSQLVTLGFSGLVPPPLQGGDTLVDSNGDPDMIPGFSVAMFCTGPVGSNDHSIDFAFLGPVADDCILVECADMGCAFFDTDSIAACADPSGLNVVQIYADLVNDSLRNEIAPGMIEVCGPDSTVYARVSIPGDTMCFAISEITLQVIDPDGMTMPMYERFICVSEVLNLNLELINFGLNYMPGSAMFFMDVDKTIPLMGDPMNYTPTIGTPIYFSAMLATGGAGGCVIMGSMLYEALTPSFVDAGDSVTVCGLECVDLTAVNAVFMANGSGATQAMWSTIGGGSFLEDNTFAGARLYCPDSADLLNGEVVLYLTVLDDPCMNPTDSLVVTIQDGAPMLLPGQTDTIDCTHPFVDNQLVNDTFPGCRMVVGCYDTIVGEIYDYDILLGDCDEDIVKQIKRTFRIEYNKTEIFCMDTIAVRGLPDTIICPPERDSVYCHTGYLKDENGHPSPLVTGVPYADSIPLWPQPNKICDILVTYKDLAFEDQCPTTIRREWFIKNGCEGTFDSCVQWIMVFDTVPPTIEMADTLISVPTGSHDCYAHVYVPPVRVTDTCTGVKMVKATIPNYGTAVMEYNPATGLYESHKQFKLPLGEIIELPDGLAVQFYEVLYEALDFCHNDTIARDTIIVTDGTRPVAVCDKGLNVTVSDTTVWIHATSIDEGSWDNCGEVLVLARRSDWYEACGVDLCDTIVPVCYTEHYDTVWCSTLEQDKHINPIEAHYAKQLEWLCSDKSACSSLLLAGWAYDLMKYATLHCKDHPYEVDDAYFKALLDECDLDDLDILLPCGKAGYGIEGVNYAFDYAKLVLGQYLKDGAFTDSFVRDIGAQLGGGWSEEVPFCCEDACQDVTVELLVMDYWCNWSKCWTTVRVEDKTPPKVVCELYDVTVTCSSYKTYYAGAVDLALEGEFDSLQNVLGRYDKVQFDQYDNVADKTAFELYDLRCDSNLVTKDSLFYDEHLGYIWKEYSYYRAEYDTIKSERYNGQIADNCGLVCIEEKPWVNLDHCGNGYIKRVFKFVGQCSTDGSGHTADTIVRTQTIWVTNDCEISPAMFEVPKDTIVYACGIEYADDGSGNVAGVVSPAYTGEGVYTFDNDCRLVGIGYYDKVFKIVGGDEACYKIVRTWCFADWCYLGTAPLDTDWWFNKAYEGKFLSFTQKIMMLDSTPPICRVNSIPPEVDAIGCFYDLNTTVEVEDECGILRYSWQVVDTKTSEVIDQDDDEFNSSTSGGFPVVAEGLGTGTYKLKVIVTDECQNESICDVPFVVNAAKKPSPVCISSLTIELTPMDSDNDGTIDTAMAEIDADQFDISSAAACGKDNADLQFRIDDGEGDAELPESSETTLYLGCEDVGPKSVRMYVVDESGSWDYCAVLLIVQNKMGGCGDISAGTARIHGSIKTELDDNVELVDILVEDGAGNLLEKVSQINGFYEVDMTVGREAIIRPVKNTDHLNGVSTRDLIDIQKHVLGRDDLDSWYKIQAADANMDSKVSPLDLVQLRKLILGMHKELPSSPSWRFFSPDSRLSTYEVNALSPALEANFVGVKIGDVNLDNNPSRSAARSSDALVLTADDQRLSSGTYQIPIRASNFKEVEGFQFTMEFDQSKLEIRSIEEGTALGVGVQHFNLQNTGEGWISASWNDRKGKARSLDEDAVLFYLLVEGKDEVQLSDAISITSRQTKAEAYHLNGEEADVALRFTGGIDADQLSLYQNRPNPWKSHTAIGFAVPDATPATLTIFDITGKVIKVKEGTFSKGYHEWQISKSNLKGHGVFYYQLKSEEESAVRKMILME
ncbi:MAG: T9SS type A sorting domain-containing protein [Saprospiraceae bacterium]|nr:T9SS type A sorting domain-containing protein [Saprospiraceae bacterium]